MMLFNKIKKTFNIRTIVAAADYSPLVIHQAPYEEEYSFWQLFYVNKGEMTIQRDGKKEVISAGQIIFRPPYKKSTMIYPPKDELYVGILDFICEDKEMNFFGEQPITLDGKEKSLISQLIKEATGFYENRYIDTALWPELISSALENFLIRLYGRMKGVFLSQSDNGKINSRNAVSDMVDRINALLEERRFSGISVKEISDILSESPNIIMKRYKAEMHESIMEHYLNLKLQSAIHLILTSDMNFTEISELLGFSSVNYFSKFFKQRMGVTPTEYSKTQD